MSDLRDLRDSVEEFLFQLAANGRRPSSLAAYARELRVLGESLGSRPLATISAGDVSRFFASPMAWSRRDGGDKAPATQNRTRAVVRAFFAWCQRTGRVDRNPVFLVRVATRPEPVVGYMSRQELRRFLAGIRHSGHPLARRDHALFSAIAYLGLRLSEVTGVAWSDLDTGRRRLVLKSVKGGRRDVRHVPRRLMHVLRHYRRATDGAEGDAPMFQSHRGKALSARSVQYRFTLWHARSGVERRLSVHSLRHTFATLLYHVTGDLLLVSRALGHRDVRTTERYAHIDDRVLARAVNIL